MKFLFFKSILFLSFFNFIKAQSIFIYASEKIKGVEIPVERTEFKIWVNDTLKKTGTSENDGSLGRISLEKGTYKLKITNEEYADAVNDAVVVNESKTTKVIINLSRLSATQIEEKKKAQKK